MLPYPVNLLHAEYHVRPWRVLDGLNRANPELRRDPVFLDGSDSAIVPELTERVCAQIARHHVEGGREILFDCARRIRQVIFKKPANNRFRLEFCWSRIRGRLDPNSG